MSLRRRALPGRALQDVSLRTMLFMRALEAPLLFTRGPMLRGVGELTLALMSATELRGGKEAWRAADAVEGLDGLAVRIDPLGEALRGGGGETDFGGVIEGIEAVAARIAPLPVLAGGPGFPMDHDDVAALVAAGVAAVDVGHADGLVEARVAAPGVPLIVSGGVADGAAAAECIARGATAIVVDEAEIAGFAEDIRIASWLAGVGHVQELGAEHLR